MEKNGLSIDIANAAAKIARGRRGLEINGKAEAGLLDFQAGHALAKRTFQEAVASGDVELILLAEYLFVTQELAESEGDEPEGMASAEAALQSFDDAFLALKAVEEGAAYHIAEQTFPHHGQWRYNGLPRDAFHVAAIAHKTRLKNGLSRLGLPKLDRELAKTRVTALGAIQQVYVERQQAALRED
ncbi:MAG: hypothetical protein LBS82_05185 [Spirochaetaceae bacterium]|jgi:hypothetical protein|nr:hypothetical protein [Spirochaetaceae bacterium]